MAKSSFLSWFNGFKPKTKKKKKKKEKIHFLEAKQKKLSIMSLTGIPRTHTYGHMGGQI